MLQLTIPSVYSMVFAYRNIGIIKRALVSQAVSETILEMKGVRIFGDEIGWHTAM